MSNLSIIKDMTTQHKALNVNYGCRIQSKVGESAFIDNIVPASREDGIRSLWTSNGIMRSIKKELKENTDRHTEENPDGYTEENLLIVYQTFTNTIQAYDKNLRNRGKIFRFATGFFAFRSRLIIQRNLSSLEKRIYKQSTANDDPIKRLDLAAKFGNKKAFIKILKRSPIKAKEIRTALDEIMIFNRNNILPIALNHLTKSNKKNIDLLNEDWTPLHHAAHIGNEFAIREILKRKPKQNITDKGGDTPLHLAASAGHRYSVGLLCKVPGVKYASKNHYHKTALDEAVERNDIGCMKPLIKASLDLLDYNNNPERLSPLHRASMAGHAQATKLLLKKGADIHLDNDNQTPLHRAILSAPAPQDIDKVLEKKFKDTVLALLSNESMIELIDTQDSNKNSALHYAILKEITSLVKFLIENDADLYQLNADKISPMDLEKQVKDKELSDYLVEVDQNLTD